MSAGELVLLAMGAGLLGIGALVWLQRHHGHVARRNRERRRQIEENRKARKHNGGAP